MRDSPVHSSGARDAFATSHWTVVLAAGNHGSPAAGRALESLCATYWFPLYAYVRRRGNSKGNAEDLVQAFFERLLARNYLDELSSDRGRFRVFLLASLKDSLLNKWNKSNPIKPGGGEAALSMDWEMADTRFQVAATDEPSPDRAFDREWALALLPRVVAQLQAECVAEGRGRLFEQLKVFLTEGKGEMAHVEVANALGMEEGAVRVAVHRLRKRYRQLLREEIANTLSDTAMVDEEMRALFGAFTV
jgi:RNA polymerase sigma-70 factor (ECF subfamily)